MVDAKSELDGRLRTVINEYVGEYVGRMTSEIDTTTLTDTADAAQQQNSNSKNQKDKQEKSVTRRVPISKPMAITALKSTRTAIQHNVPVLKRKLEEYIDNTRTREMLLAAVLEGVLGKYEKFWERIDGIGTDMINESGSGSGAWGESGGDYTDKKKNKNKDDGNDDENMPWSPATFTQWCMSVFGIGRVGRNDTTTAVGMGTERNSGNRNMSKKDSTSQASRQSSVDGVSGDESESESESENEIDERDNNGDNDTDDDEG